MADKNVMKSITKTIHEYINDGIVNFVILDFDGVVNMISHNTTPKTAFNFDNIEAHPNPLYDKSNPRKMKTDGEPKNYTIRWSDELIDELNIIAARKDTVIIWLTTWRLYMADVVDRLKLTAVNEMVYMPWGAHGLDEEKYDSSVRSGSPQWEKIDSLVEYMSDLSVSEGLRKNVKLVWVDDQVLVPVTIKENPLRKSLDNSNQLLIGPNPSYGISRAELDEIKTFLN